LTKNDPSIGGSDKIDLMSKLKKDLAKKDVENRNLKEKINSL
jgi:hypothetical protein